MNKNVLLARWQGNRKFHVVQHEELVLSIRAERGWGAGVLYKFFTLGGSAPEVQPLTLLYTILTKKLSLSNTFC